MGSGRLAGSLLLLWDASSRRRTGVGDARLPSEFSLASGRPVSFDALAGAGKPLDGGDALLDPQLEERQRTYLSELERALPDPEAGGEALYPLWLAACPEPLADVLAPLTHTEHKVG